MVYINNGEDDNPHELPKDNLEGFLDTVYHIYQHFQDHEKVYETDLQVTTEHTDDTLYPKINNDIEYV